MSKRYPPKAVLQALEEEINAYKTEKQMEYNINKWTIEYTMCQTSMGLVKKKYGKNENCHCGRRNDAGRRIKYKACCKDSWDVNPTQQQISKMKQKRAKEMMDNHRRFGVENTIVHFPTTQPYISGNFNIPEEDQLGLGGRLKKKWPILVLMVNYVPLPPPLPPRNPPSRPPEEKGSPLSKEEEEEQEEVREVENPEERREMQQAQQQAQQAQQLQQQARQLQQQQAQHQQQQQQQQAHQHALSQTKLRKEAEQKSINETREQVRLADAAEKVRRQEGWEAWHKMTGTKFLGGRKRRRKTKKRKTKRRRTRKHKKRRIFIKKSKRKSKKRKSRKH
jgi:hypothetical protein